MENLLTPDDSPAGISSSLTVVMVRLRSYYSIKHFVAERSIFSLDVVPAGCFRSDPDKPSGLGAADKHILMGKLYWELVK